MLRFVVIVPARDSAQDRRQYAILYEGVAGPGDDELVVGPRAARNLESAIDVDPRVGCGAQRHIAVEDQRAGRRAGERDAGWQRAAIVGFDVAVVRQLAGLERSIDDRIAVDDAEARQGRALRHGHLRVESQRSVDAERAAANGDVARGCRSAGDDEIAVSRFAEAARCRERLTPVGHLQGADIDRGAGGERRRAGDGAIDADQAITVNAIVRHAVTISGVIRRGLRAEVLGGREQDTRQILRIVARIGLFQHGERAGNHRRGHRGALLEAVPARNGRVDPGGRRRVRVHVAAGGRDAPARRHAALLCVIGDRLVRPDRRRPYDEAALLQQAGEIVVFGAGVIDARIGVDAGLNEWIERKAIGVLARDWIVVAVVASRGDDDFAFFERGERQRFLLVIEGGSRPCQQICFGHRRSIARIVDGDVAERRKIGERTVDGIVDARRPAIRARDFAGCGSGEDLKHHEVRAIGDARRRCPGRSRRDAGDMRAVTVDVDELRRIIGRSRRGHHEALAARIDLAGAGEPRGRLIGGDAGVADRDGDAGARIAGRPGDRRSDEGQPVLKRARSRRGLREGR